MANKLCVVPLLLALAAPLRAELLRLSLLGRPAPAFTLKLDIFQSRSSGPEISPGSSAPMTPLQAETLKKSIAEEIQQSVTYEGFIVMNGKESALLNVSGEFFTVGVGEVILEKIKVLKIGKDKVTIEYDNLPYDIPFKGE